MIRLRTAFIACVVCILFLSEAFAPAAAAADATIYRSHSPIRPLPVASTRPMGQGPSYFVDSGKGNDAANGSASAPWQSVNVAASRLKPGDTLYLRAGTYYESVTIRTSGTKEKPITIRAYPGELAIIDGGIREFFEDPAHAWEPCPDGAPDEYQSTKTYTTGGGCGQFGDSMVPFQRYLTFADLRSSNELFRPELENRSNDSVGIYAGPGVRRDTETNRIHIRLAHTKLEGLGANAYTGETDPRKLPLVISGADYALALEHSENVNIQDIVVRGGHRTAVRIELAKNIELDGSTMYAGGSALTVSQTHALHMTNSALRGFAAPWHSRFIHKDRSKSGYLFVGSGDDIEIANCELTDHHDGIQFHGIDGFKFHHNLVENFNDDAMEPGVKQTHGTTLIYCNHFARLLSPFTAHGKKPQPVTSEEGSGIYIYRNIIDIREGVYTIPPAKPDPSGAFLSSPNNTMLHDHGSPVQPNYYVYQNTFITGGPAWRNIYAISWGARTSETLRRVFNNICFQVDGVPGTTFAVAPDDDFQADGNLLWSLHAGPTLKSDIFDKFRKSDLFTKSKTKYAPGWAANDIVADPKFMNFREDYHEASDLQLEPDSAAINAGQVLPGEWPDPLRKVDSGKPDIGAVPVGAAPWRIGVNGRYSAFGQ